MRPVRNQGAPAYRREKAGIAVTVHHRQHDLCALAAALGGSYDHGGFLRSQCGHFAG